jgi:triacylglycerol lipase
VAWSSDSIRVRHPIILIHGIGARPNYGPVPYFYGLPEILSKQRIPHYSVNLPAWRSFLNRSEELKKQIEKKFPEGKVNLIGHSMGGLDARYLISKLGFHDRVESLTTIGTPHHGTSLAEIALAPVGGRERTWVRRFFGALGYPVEALDKLTPQFCREQLGKDGAAHPDVAYYSTTSAIPKQDYRKRSLPIFWLSNKMIRKAEGENDGMISVDSARFGEELAVFPGDHYAQIGQIVGRSRGLDYPALYSMILRNLARRGH